MIINYVDEHFDLEEEERINQELIAIRYTGRKSSITPSKYNRDAAWPSFSPLQGGPKDADADGERLPGPPQGAIVPDWTDDDVEDRTVEALESDPNIEVFYDPATIAECMLETNFLDPNVFGQGFDPDVRDFVFDTLGLEDVGIRNESEYRAQLREIAGIGDPGDEIETEAVDDTRKTELRQDNTRSDLVEACRILEHDDPDNLGKIDAAGFLAEQDPAAVRYALEGKPGAAREAAGLTGDDEDVEPAETFEPADALEAYEPEELKDVVKSVREGTGEFSLRGAGAEDMAEFLVETKDLSEDEIDAHLTE